MKQFWPLLTFAGFLVVLNFEFGQSAIVPQNGVITIRVPGNKPNQTKKENITMDTLMEAVDDYIDLSDAFYGPAASEVVREKRTMNVFQRVAKRARDGVRTLRNLFSGRRRTDDSESGSETPRSGGFRKFFSDLLNRILVFFTTLWDRITGFFRRDRGSDEEGGTRPKSFLTRLRDRATSLVKRFRNRNKGESGSSSGSSGSRFSIQGVLDTLKELNPQSTQAPYVPGDYDNKDSDSDKNDDIKEKPAESDADAEAEAMAEKAVESSSSASVISDASMSESQGGYISGGYSSGGYSSDGYTGSNAVRSYSDAAYSDHSASASWDVGSFVPFPMDSDPNYHLNGARSSSYYTIPVNPWSSSRSRREVRRA